MTDRAAPRTEATAEQQLFDLIEPLMPFTNADAVRRAVREVIAETRREVAAAPAPAIDVERLREAYDTTAEDWSTGEAGFFELLAAEYQRLGARAAEPKPPESRDE